MVQGRSWGEAHDSLSSGAPVSSALPKPICAAAARCCTIGAGMAPEKAVDESDTMCSISQVQFLADLGPISHFFSLLIEWTPAVP